MILIGIKFGSQITYSIFQTLQGSLSMISGAIMQIMEMYVNQRREISLIFLGGNSLCCSQYGRPGRQTGIFISLCKDERLILTQALITAHNNARYRQIKKNTIGIAFLGTPHRGADLAKMLKGLLDVSFSESRFVKDLLPDSQIIKEINDSFGDRAQALQLASFSESTGMILVGVSISV